MRTTLIALLLLLPAGLLRAEEQKAEPQPIASFTVGEKTFERVSLMAVKGRVVTISHAFGVKDLSISQLSLEQIEQLNTTSAKVKIELPKPPPSTNVVSTVPPVQAPTNQVAQPTPSPAPSPQESAMEEARIQSGGALPSPQPAVAPSPAAESPASEAAAARPPGSDPASKMAAEFQELAASGQEGGGDEEEEDAPRADIPWYVRLSAWAGFFMGGIGVLWLCGAAIHNNDSLTWALLIFFLSPPAAIVYFILNFRNVWIPFVFYIVGFFMLAIPRVIYRMDFFDLMM